MSYEICQNCKDAQDGKSNKPCYCYLNKIISENHSKKRGSTICAHDKNPMECSLCLLPGANEEALAQGKEE